MTFLQFVVEYWWLGIVALILISLFTFSIRKSAAKSAEQALASRRSEVEQFLFKKSTSLDFYRTELEQHERDLTLRESKINDLVRSRMIDTVRNIARRDYLSQTPAFQAVLSDFDDSRLFSALSQSFKITSPFDISARIAGKSGKVYDVTLHSCTCEDFSFRGQPCKHMSRLAVEVGALIGYDLVPLSNQVSNLLAQRDALQSEQKKLNKLRVSLQAERSDLDSLRAEDCQRYPWLSKLYADYYDAFNGTLETRLRTKRPPAAKAADDVSTLRRETQQILQQSKMNEYQLHFYEALFPWLEEFKELTPQDAYLSQSTLSDDPDAMDEYDNVLKSLLSPDECQQPSACKKYQLALDRYQRRPKTNWEIGIEYERYIGYLCEQVGYRVQYTGAKLGLEDMGRDLVLSGENKKIVVQCKRWSRDKRIHEKHIFQLFGTSILLETQSPGVQVISVFVTTASLSETARLCASRLGVKVHENISMQPYPVIKCNISHTGEKIYHLPFDQQYDRVIVDTARGEFFASTVSDAEAAGFRRAFRHSTHSDSK